MSQTVNVHSSIEFIVIAIYPSVEQKDKIAVLVQYPNGGQEVLYLSK